MAISASAVPAAALRALPASCSTACRSAILSGRAERTRARPFTVAVSNCSSAIATVKVFTWRRKPGWCAPARDATSTAIVIMMYPQTVGIDLQPEQRAGRFRSRHDLGPARFIGLAAGIEQIGREACRERGGQDGEIRGGAGPIKKKKK